jgi:hypothetical protein
MPIRVGSQYVPNPTSLKLIQRTSLNFLHLITSG